jgi:hypothetical protein
MGRSFYIRKQLQLIFLGLGFGFKHGLPEYDRVARLWVARLWGSSSDGKPYHEPETRITQPVTRNSYPVTRNPNLSGYEYFP